MIINKSNYVINILNVSWLTISTAIKKYKERKINRYNQVEEIQMNLLQVSPRGKLALNRRNYWLNTSFSERKIPNSEQTKPIHYELNNKDVKNNYSDTLLCIHEKILQT